MNLPRPPAPEKGNILLVANWESGVGYAWWLMQRYWVTIASRYAGSGTRSFLIYPKITDIPPEIAAAPIIVEERNFSGRGVKGLLGLLRFVRRRRIRNVYLSDRPVYGLLYLLLRLCGVRRIVVHDHTPGDRPRIRGLKRVLKRLRAGLPLLNADFFIGATTFVQQRLVENGCLSPRKCGVATNGIEPIHLDNATVDVRAELGLPGDAVIIVSTGRLQEYKGVGFLIELADRVTKVNSGHRVRFVYVGDGPDRDVMEDKVRRLSLHDCFIFAGHRSDVRLLLPSCNVGVQASLGEVGYSLTILEYMSAGLPTLVPNLPSTSLATEHGVTGLTYRSRDLDDACDKLVGLLIDPSAAASMGRRAAERVQQRFHIRDSERMLGEIVDREFV